MVKRLPLPFSGLIQRTSHNKLMTFSYFAQKKGFDISYSTQETICMKCQNLFAGKSKKNISECGLQIFIQSAKK